MNGKTLVLPALVLLSAVGQTIRGAPATRPDSAREVSVAIAQLGDDDGNVRDAAGRKLPSIGKAAQPALRAAARGDDPEAAARAGQVLAEMRFGIDGETPAALIDLVREYLDTLAQVQFRHGRRQAAIETAKHGLELAPGFEDLRRQLKRFSQDKPASRPG